MMNPTYLGDSVYIQEVDYGFKIYTNNGNGPENEIYLEPEVARALMGYINRSQP